MTAVDRPTHASTPAVTSLHHVLAALGLPVDGRPDTPLRGVAALHDATPDELSFAGSSKRLPDLLSTRAGVVLLSADVRPAPTFDRPERLIAVPDAELALSRVLPLFAPPVPHPKPGVHPTAMIDATARVDASAGVGPHVVVGANTTIGPGCRVHANVVIGQGVTIGRDCTLYPNVVVRERCTLGDRVILNAGAVIGTDGFGYRWDGRRHVPIPHIGGVLLEDDVEIGSCACVDRAKFARTVIGRGTKVDNLVQIGHNVRTGPHCILTGQVAIAGSVTLGTGVVMGGGSAVREHIAIGDGARVAGLAGVTTDLPKGTTVSGVPALPHRQSLREQAALRRLPELLVQVKRLSEELAALKRDPDAPPS